MDRWKTYFLKYRIYAVLAILVAVFYSIVTGRLCWEMFLISLCTLFLLRILDDYFDYDTDRKEKILTRKQLRDAGIVLGVLFVVLHVVFFGVTGLLSILIILYLVMMDKAEILKVFLLTLLTAFYLSQYIGFRHGPTLIILLVCLTVSVAFYFYKTGRRKD